MSTDAGETRFRAGYAAFLGRPNVGKSSLLNVLVGAHLGAVSAKPHTTRQSVIGVRTFEHAQIAFVDTPGLQARRPNAVHKAMDRALAQAVHDVSLIILVVEAGAWKAGDARALQRAQENGAKIALLINKVDTIKDKTTLLPYIQRLSKLHDFAAVLLCSATKEMGTIEACKRLADLLPEQEALFDSDMLTDRSERFLAAELVREQLMRQLQDEVPYACAVEIEGFEIEGTMRRINAVVWVEREGQKAIVIGDGGDRLKRVGTNSRLEMEKLFDGKVHLELWVKVRPNWTDDDRALKVLGFD